MNKSSFIHRGVHFSWRSVSLTTLMILALAGFTGCATDNTPPPQTADQAHSEMIILREGDELKITFPGSSNLDSTQQIRRDGKIVMPLIGEVQASGMTPDALRQSLVKLYASQISSQEINVFVQSSTFPVYVTGSVVHPGKIQSDHPITALEAVMEAGGFDFSTANTHHVRVLRSDNGKTVRYYLDLQKVLDQGTDKPFYLKPQDIIYVPQRFQMF